MAQVEEQQAESIEQQQPMQTFKVRPQLLESGKQTTSLVGDDLLKATVMVADSGGETVVHSHLAMDQIFFVLAGEATFYKSLDEVAAVLGPMEGILVPRGSAYWYEKTSEENLVLFRAAAMDDNAPHESPRFSQPLRAPVPIKVRDGAFFGE